MAQLDELKQMRKSRMRKRTAKRFVVLMLLSIIIFIMYIVWEEVKELDIKTRIDDIIISMGSGPGYPVDIAGREAISFYELSGMPAVLNDSNNFVYNEKGKTVTNIQHGYNMPIAYGSKGKILMFDLGGTKLNVYSRSKLLFEKKFDKPIINGDICETGAFAVATDSENYVGEVFVYNKKGKNIFIWSSAENIITDVNLSPNGEYLAVTAINSDGGSLVSFLYIFKISSQSIKKIDFADEYPLEVCFKDNSTVTVVTDKSIKSYSSTGREAGQYSYNGKILYKFDVKSAKNNILVFQGLDNKSDYKVVQLGNKSNFLSEYQIDEEIIDIGIDEKGGYITCEDKVIFINLSGHEVERIDTPLVKKSLVIGSKLYYTTHNMVYKTGVRRNHEK